MALLYWKQVIWLFSLSKDDTKMTSRKIPHASAETLEHNQVRSGVRLKNKNCDAHYPFTCKTNTKYKSSIFFLLVIVCALLWGRDQAQQHLAAANRIVCFMEVHLIVKHPRKVVFEWLCMCVCVCQSVRNKRRVAFKFSRCSNSGASVFLTLKIKMTDQREPVQPDFPFQDQTSCLVTDTDCTGWYKKQGPQDQEGGQTSDSASFYCSWSVSHEAKLQGHRKGGKS